MSLDEKTIRHVATLAGLAVSDEQLDPLRSKLNEIVDYFDSLSRLNTRGVVPTSHVHGVVNAFREDIIKTSMPLEDVEAIAPDFATGGFRVPKIVG